MRRGSNNPWGPLEYILLILLVLMVLFTIFSLFWPAIKLYYETILQK
jgi:hypothetical protein